ncbi:MAG: hypothetical protein MUO55_05690 [Candidatus Atribacteria bacterium]|nr:hypothetical protein [Candidatus Atribacteria bacterium]
MERLPEKDSEQYWKKKEDDIGEKIRGRMLAEFIDGYQNFSGPILGILFYTESAFYFQTFPKKNWFLPLLKPGESLCRDKLLNFCIPWSNVKKIDFPPRKNPFLGLFLSQEYRIFIDYQNNGNRTNLAITMQSREDRDKLIGFYKKMQKSM